MTASRPRPYPAGVYYHFVSWSLMAMMPALLMLAAIGLERIEIGLQRSAAVKPVVDQAET